MDSRRSDVLLPRRVRHLAALLAVLALFTASGCASDPAGSPDATTAPTTTAGAAAAPVEPAAAPAAPRTATPRAWAHETSDIPVDPRIRFGSFSNGLRWAWAANPKPEDRCYLRLHVDAGSLAEEDHEQGLAHFLEHMAFNGTENFAEGTLIEWFQNHGMSFGADTNAHTAFSETVYKLDLPKNDEATLRDGLRVLRDFADRMLLIEKEVQAEKGVIDGEQRERDSAGFRVLIKQLELVFAGTRISNRLPIGVKEVRDRFNADIVRAFYEKWYRPENMTLVAVGDFGGRNPEELFREAFADMEVPAAPLVAEPGPGTAKSYSHTFAIHEKEIPSVQVSLARVRPWVKEEPTKANWLKDLPLSYARSMLNQRYGEMVNKGTAPFLGAGVSSGSAFDVIDGEDLTVTCNPENWEEAFAAGEKELRRALQFGFQQAELDELRADALRGLDESVEREKSADSRSLLNAILSAAENPFVPTNAETRRSIMKPALQALTVEACHKALVDEWNKGEVSLSLVGNLDLGADAPAILRKAYDESRKQPVEAAAKIEASAFAYASDPAKAGKVVSREHVDDLDFELVRFENGVALNVKRTDFKEKQVLMTVNIGEGNLTLDPAKTLVLSQVAGAVANGSGLEAHTVDDLRRLTAGKQVGVGFGVGGDRFTLNGGTTKEDFLFQCELACAGITHPGWRDESLAQMRQQLPLFYEQMKHSPGGPIQQEFLPALFSNDPRVGVAPMEDVLACGVDDVRGWLEPLMADAPIEITVVGDLDLEATIEAVARTFGTLPKRRAWKSFDAHRDMPAPKPGVRMTRTIETQIPKSLVLIAFPTTDGMDVVSMRKQNLLNTVVNDRLRLEVRERLGAAYSPGSGVQASTINPGVGLLFMQAMADPDKVETLVQACLDVADSLAKDGITDEEMTRLLEPIRNQRRDSKRTNGYWLQFLARAQSEPGQLDDIRSGDAFYEAVKAADITPLAKEYMPSERASVMIVNPE